MNAPSAAVRPRAYWYFVALFVLVVGIGVAYWLISSGASDMAGSGADAQPLRGSGVIDIKQPGMYSVYIYRGASKRTNASANRAWESARNAEVVVRNEQTGTELAVQKAYESIDLQNSLIAKLVDFEVPVAGTYVVEVPPALGELGPAVRPTAPLADLQQDLVNFMAALFAGLGVGALATLIAAIISLVTLIRRSSCKKRLAREAATVAS